MDRVASLYEVSGWANHISFHMAQIFNEYMENPDKYPDESRDLKEALTESETSEDFAINLQKIVDKHLIMDFKTIHFGKLYQEIMVKGSDTAHYDQIAGVLWHLKN
jgi:hypothetical protein